MLKFILLCMFAVVAVLFMRVILLGKLHAGVEKHASAARHAFWGTIFYVVLIEAAVRVTGGAVFDALFYAHLAFAIPFFLGISLLRFRFTGLRSHWHAALAYTTIIFFLGTAATGIPLILLRF